MNEIAQKSKSTNRYLLFIILLLIINTLILFYHNIDFRMFQNDIMFSDCMFD